MLGTTFRRIVVAATLGAAWVLPMTGLGQTWVNNRTGNSTFNFSVLDGASPRAIGMADPTVLVLNVEGVETYYVTGTTDDHRTGNFAIYKSTDLDNWTFHQTAFDGGSGTYGGVSYSMNVPFPPVIPSPQPAWMLERNSHPSYPANPYLWYLNIGSRAFTHLWSPHLWVNPNGLDPNVYLCFTATEIRDPAYPTLEQLSIMISSMPKVDFISGNGFFGAPVWYYYEVDNAGGPVQADGGAANGSHWTIPATTSLDPGYSGWVTKLLSGSEHTARPDARTNLTDAPFVFFDLGDGADPDIDSGVVSHRPWLLYTCAQYKARSTATCEACGLDPGDFHGGNSAAFPLYMANLFDASPVSIVWSPVDLFHRFNNYNRPPCVTCPGQICGNAQYVGPPYSGWYAVPNGSVEKEPSDPCAPQWMFNPFTPPVTPDQYYFGGYAEGPSAFYYQNRYYLFISRNMWSGPAYMMTYRIVEDSSSTTFENTGLSSPTDRSVYEDVLMASDWLQAYGGARDSTCKRSYGGGEVFMANGKPYMIFHALTKENPTNNPNARRIYFKELTVEANGKLKRLYEPHPVWSPFPPPPAAQDLGKFLIP